MSSYITMVYSLSDGIRYGFRNWISWRVSENYQQDKDKDKEIEEKEDAHDGVWFHGQGQWAAIGDNQIDQLVNHMREVHESREELNQSGIETAQLFSWEMCARKIMDVAGRNSQPKSIENFTRVEIG